MGAVSLATAPGFHGASTIAAATILGADEDTGLGERPPPPSRERFFFVSLRGELSSPPVAPYFFVDSADMVVGLGVEPPPPSGRGSLALTAAVARSHGRRLLRHCSWIPPGVRHYRCHSWALTRTVGSEGSPPP